MDGLLIIDKPVGPTSHDVVARVRRLLREPRIGHTGTLDPAASGVLALVIGRATRLAQFMGADEKAYDARIQLGVRTDTYDADGTTIGERYSGPWPSRQAIEEVLNSLRGTRLQQPPAYSAKKIAGQRAYAAARARARRGVTATSLEPHPPLPAPVAVTLSHAAITGCDEGQIGLSLTCSAGFYVRSLAHDIGEQLGIGGHLTGLRRTRSGQATLDQALPIEGLEAAPERAQEAVLPMKAMLPQLPALTLTEAGVARTLHGMRLGPHDFVSPDEFHALARTKPVEGALTVRLLTSAGDLVAVGNRVGESAWLIHAGVVLSQADA